VSQTQWREPAQISAGDSVSFTRRLYRYPASQGWSLLYAMRGGAQAIEFESTANVDDHVILVEPAITETWAPAEYILEGWALSSVDGTRTQIYLAPFKVALDLSTAPGDAVITTHAQRMLASIEQQLEGIAQNVLDATDVEGTRIQRAKREELWRMRSHYRHEREGEIATLRAKSGLPSQRKIRTVFNITPPGAVGIRQFGAGNSIYNTEWP
jgi:hypothetical protein